ncbi:hypothetical protein LTR94_007744 [Friedmanniomyces endolithicus]|nr:hypothetical protein LTR94_007744 [Friedmanniomyces endolithicus]KAK0817366.1 hypothetical protein LTR75_003105 [Friedmanniomyces endolithicus]KAK0847454.1 hypothetical protein LTR03_006239 [Friedmanniomyces endolithicus]
MWGTVFVQVERERVEVVRNTGLVEQMIVEVVMVAGMVLVTVVVSVSGLYVVNVPVVTMGLDSVWIDVVYAGVQTLDVDQLRHDELLELVEVGELVVGALVVVVPYPAGPLTASRGRTAAAKLLDATRARNAGM